MQLSINRYNQAEPVRLVEIGEKLTFGWAYVMHDAPDCYVIITGDGPDAIMVEIGHRDRRPARRERIELLHSIVGCYPDGSPASMPCVLQLSPNAPAFPINGLVQRLMNKEGVGRFQITPLNRLHNMVTDFNHAPLSMFGDGLVSQYGSSNQAFVLKGGTWAILASGREIIRVYLTLDAANKTKEIVQTIARIRSGAAQPVYAGE